MNHLGYSSTLLPFLSLPYFSIRHCSSDRQLSLLITQLIYVYPFIAEIFTRVPVSGRFAKQIREPYEHSLGCPFLPFYALSYPSSRVRPCMYNGFRSRRKLQIRGTVQGRVRRETRVGARFCGTRSSSLSLFLQTKLETKDLAPFIFPRAYTIG